MALKPEQVMGASRKYTDKKTVILNQFQLSSTLSITKSTLLYDLIFFKDAIKEIKLYGASSSDQFYILQLSYNTSNQLAIYISKVGFPATDEKVCSYYYNSIRLTGLKKITLAESNGSRITGTILIDFDYFPSGSSLGTGGLNYSVSGLADQCKVVTPSWSSVTDKPIDALEIISPSVIDCVVGHNTNINLDNVLLNGDYFQAERFVLSGKGTIEGEFEYIPTVVGDESFTFEYYEGNVELKSKTVTFRTVSGTVAGTKKIMIIGDSTTNSGIPSSELLNLCNGGTLTVDLLGTRGTAPALHEGRYGWTTDNYINSDSAISGTDGEVINPFYNPETSTFDFGYYMTQQGYTGVDIVIINLGINDVSNGMTKEETLVNYQTMVDSINAYNANVKVVVALTTLPTRFANQWGYASSTGRKNQLLDRLKLLLNTFENQEASNIFIAPVYMYLNPFWDMQYAEKALSSRNTKTFFYATDNTHPSTIGYNKVADCYFNVIKYIASLS